jgi:UDP-hydrolysing UDP-N-acetyl-D-glucosamine 2-epimerase
VAARRTIAVLSVGRSDFGRLRPVLRALRKIPALNVALLAGGNHEDPRFGKTAAEIAASGFAAIAGLGFAVADDAPAAIGKAIAVGTEKLTRYFDANRPDILVVLGDRFELLAGTAAAIGFGIPIAHIHGGTVSEGAIDELVRHAVTKMSHLHMVSCDVYAQRIMQMGEEPWRVNVVGAPIVDEIVAIPFLSRAELSRYIGLDMAKPTLLATYHPVTLEAQHIEAQVDTFVRVLEAAAQQVVLTYPNTDTGSHVIIERIEAFAARNPARCRILKNAGTELFLSTMKAADTMIGNSSAAILEAAVLKTPAVNIGTRQDGKIRGANVIDVGYDEAEIAAALARAASPAFRAEITGMTNPYGDGTAGERIARILADVPLDDRLMRKKFCDLAVA